MLSCVLAEHKVVCPMGPGYGPDGLGELYVLTSLSMSSYEHHHPYESSSERNSYTLSTLQICGVNDNL